MNYIATSTYLTVWSISSFFLIFLMRIIKDKPLDQQNVIDKIRTDMCFFTYSYITYVIWMIIIREIVGPYPHTLLLDGLLLFVLFTYYTMLCSVVTHQIIQLLSIFYSNYLFDANEFLIVAIHRVTVILLSAVFSGLLCYFKSGTCYKNAFVVYFIGETEIDKSAPNIGFLPNTILTLVIILCQLLVEIKRCMYISEDLKGE